MSDLPVLITRYRLTSTGHSSIRFGKCEVCGTHTAEVFHQVEQKLYPRYSEEPQAADAPTGYTWTFWRCTDLFGHEECLKSRQGGHQLPLSLEVFRAHFCAGREFDSCANSPCQFSGQVCQHPLYPRQP